MVKRDKRRTENMSPYRLQLEALARARRAAKKAALLQKEGKGPGSERAAGTGQTP